MAKDIAFTIFIGILAGIVSALIILGAGLFTGQTQQAFAGLTHLSGMSVGSDGLAVTDNGSVTFSAATTTINGVSTFYKRSTLITTASSTVCAIPSPTGTSTLQSFTYNQTTSTGTASVGVIAKAASPNATTTTLADFNILASTKGTFGTATSTADSVIIAPNQFITVGLKGAASGFLVSGVCTAIFTSAD